MARNITQIYTLGKPAPFPSENGMPIPKQISHKRPTDLSPRGVNNFVPAIGIERECVHSPVYVERLMLCCK